MTRVPDPTADRSCASDGNLQGRQRRSIDKFKTDIISRVMSHDTQINSAPAPSMDVIEMTPPTNGGLHGTSGEESVIQTR